MPRFDQSAHGAVALHAGFDKLQTSQYHGQKMVEIMRDAAGQLADRFHLLRLLQLVPGKRLLGDIRRCADPMLGAEALILEQSGLHDGEAYRAVGTDNAILIGNWCVGLERFGPCRPGPVAVRFVHIG